MCACQSKCTKTHHLDFKLTDSKGSDMHVVINATLNFRDDSHSAF